MWRCGVVLSLSPPCFLTCNSGSCTPENSSYSVAPLTWPQLSTGSDNNVSSFAPSGIKAEKSSCCYCPLSAPTFLNLVCVLIAKLCPTLCDPMDCKPPSSSVHRILQARILEWVTVPFSRGSSQPRDRIWVSCVTGRFFTNRATKEALKVKRVYKFSISQHVQLRLTKDSDPWLPYSKIIKNVYHVLGWNVISYYDRKNAHRESNISLLKGCTLLLFFYHWPEQSTWTLEERRKVCLHSVSKGGKKEMLLISTNNYPLYLITCVD